LLIVYFTIEIHFQIVFQCLLRVWKFVWAMISKVVSMFDMKVRLELTSSRNEEKKTTQRED